MDTPESPWTPGHMIQCGRSLEPSGANEGAPVLGARRDNRGRTGRSECTEVGPLVPLGWGDDRCFESRSTPKWRSGAKRARWGGGPGPHVASASGSDEVARLDQFGDEVISQVVGSMLNDLT